LAIPVAPFPARTYERPYYYVLVLLLAFAMLLTFVTMATKIGLSLSAVRNDEDKARGIGVRVTGVKLLSFSISVGLTAMVGGVWAYYEGFIYPQFAIDPLITIAIVLMTFLGGRATLWGPVLGAFILEMAQQYLAYSLGGSKLYLIAYALIFLVVMLWLPRGILPSIQDRLRRRRRRQSKHPTRVQSDAVRARSSSPVAGGGMP
jgi:branched-chain amino acid transport system permease protein